MSFEDYNKLKFRQTGVYLLTCDSNGKQYIGSSVDIKMRVGTHFYRDFKHYPWREFYQDIAKYGFDGFSITVLELCDRDQLISREQYWYDQLKPVYNFARPVVCPFDLSEVRKLSIERSNTPEKVAERKRLFNTDKYKDIFRYEAHATGYNAIKACDAYTKDGELVGSFRSLAEAARWVEEVAPEFRAKNKVSKVKSVCDGERRSAFGYVFKYHDTSVTTMAQASTESIDTASEADGTLDGEPTDVKR